MLQAFVFNETAILVRHWFEIGPDAAEHGARIEICRRIRPPHRGSESASQAVELDHTLWRADLFDLYDGTPGNFERAHYHKRFEGPEPSPRSWDDDLSADPMGWAETQLADFAALIASCGHHLESPEEEQRDVRAHLDEISAAARKAAGSNCRSPQACLEATRDTTDIVAVMGAMFRSELPDDSRDPRSSTTV